MLFTENYKYKDDTLGNLAVNPSITPKMQRLLFTEDYKEKRFVLSDLVINPSFLKLKFTPEEWYNVRKSAKGKVKLLLLKIKLQQIQGIKSE